MLVLSSVFIMPSDKRDSTRKSERTSASGSGSGVRPSATVTSGSAMPVLTAASSRSGVVSTTSGTVRTVTSVAGSKRLDRDCPVLDVHRGSSCSTASVSGINVDVVMPQHVDDVCDAMFSDDSMSGARRAPIGFNPVSVSDSRAHSCDDRRHPAGVSSRSAGSRPVSSAVGPFAVPGYGPGPAPMPFPYYAGWGPSAPQFNPLAYPSMAAAGRGAAGFGAGYAPALVCQLFPPHGGLLLG